MAGIGFELRHLIHKDTYTADAGAYLVAGFALTGGMIVSIASVVALTAASASVLSGDNLTILLKIITFSYAGAMILTAPASLLVVRYIADRLYIGDVSTLGPCFASCSICTWIATFLAGTVFYGPATLPLETKILSVLLLVACAQIWLASLFFSAGRSYSYVASSFLICYAAATALAILWGKHFDLSGYLAGFTLGMAALAVALTVRLQAQLSYPINVSFDYRRLIATRPALALTGIGLFAGIWTDKLVFWMAQGWHHPLETHPGDLPTYDLCFFLAYLTAIPLYVHFMLHVETRFARQVRSVYTSLVRHFPLKVVKIARARLTRTLNSIHWGLVLFQAPITLIALVIAPVLLEVMRIPELNLHILRYHLLAAPAIVLLQVHVLYLLYFDQAEAAAAPAMLYLAANLGLSALSLWTGAATFGLGHLVAVYWAATVAVQRVRAHLPWLEYEALASTARLNFQTARKTSGGH